MLYELLVHHVSDGLPLFECVWKASVEQFIVLRYIMDGQEITAICS